MFQFLTPQVFDALIWGTILIGLVLAGLRLYRDLFVPHRGRRSVAGIRRRMSGEEWQETPAAWPDEQEK